MSWDVNWRDGWRCAVTGHQDCTLPYLLFHDTSKHYHQSIASVHPVPGAERTWFLVNRMAVCALSRNEGVDVDDPANGRRRPERLINAYAKRAYRNLYARFAYDY